MRLLLINYEFPPLGGGAGNAAANLAREFANRGIGTMVVTSRFKGLLPLEEDRGVRIVRLPVVRRRLDRSSAPEMLSFLASSLVCPLREIHAFRPDAAIAFFGLPSGPLAYLLKVFCRIPYIISLRGGDVPGFQTYDLAVYHRLTGPVIAFLWKKAGGVVANSQGLAQLARDFAPDQKIDIIPNGVDIDHFHPARGSRDSSVCRLLFVGRLQYQKGVDVLLDALARIKPDMGWRLDVVGDGPARNDLEKRCHDLGLSDSVHFLGWKSRPELPSIYSRSDLFVLPSRDEGMPNVILEAMASGLPVAATSIAGNEELVCQGLTGCLTPPDNVAALAEMLGPLVGDVDMLRKMGEAGRKRVVERYTWAKAAEDYLGLLEGMKTGKKPF